ncbi:ABC transporter permease [Reichenbachiella versicolor]|uniref:ABC transporter permease n=1 Tax=Reichenbachiella versicolor TaxID=1821036 RepID=UPI000D6E6281|nr:ABC transporter permease [Reichenbachiella versicolor]
MSFLFKRDTWQEVFDSIGKNRVRTLITVIGVLWGIFIYIALSGAAKGLDNGFEKDFEKVSKNSMFLWTQPTSIPYGGYKIGRQFSLKYSDIPLFKSKVPEIQHIAPRSLRGRWGIPPGKVVRGQRTGEYTIYGDVPVFTKIFSMKFYDGGRFINPDDIKEARKVCLIGERIQEELFEEDENPIGQYIRIDGVFFLVIGVHVYEQGGGFNSDSDIHIPFTTFRSMYNRGDKVGWFALSAHDNTDVVAVEEKIKATAKEIYRVHPDDERGFGSFNLGREFRRVSGFAKGVTLLSIIVGIATILAGVVGIGNILLISVKERTKEFGIRRALGATPSEVRGQILLESVFLTLSAGMFGIVLGSLVLTLIRLATQDLNDFPFTNPTVPVILVISSLLIMVVLGTLIGLIPAQRAVSIKPIDALREE